MENRREALQGEEERVRLRLECKTDRWIKKRTSVLPTCNPQVLLKYLALQSVPLVRMTKVKTKNKFLLKGGKLVNLLIYIYASFQLPSFIFHSDILLLWGYSTPFVKRSFGSIILVDYLFVFIYMAFNYTIKCICISVLFLKI